MASQRVCAKIFESVVGRSILMGSAVMETESEGRTSFAKSRPIIKPRSLRYRAILTRWRWSAGINPGLPMPFSTLPKSLSVEMTAVVPWLNP